MPTLNDISYESRTIFKWFIILGAIVFVIFIFFNIGVYVKNILYPKPPPAPEVKFGKLPKIRFETDQTENKNYTYALDTISGDLPVFADREKVYQIKKNKANLLALRNVQAKVKSLYFNAEPIPATDRIYEWETTEPFPKKITYDIVANNFTFTSEYISLPYVISAQNLGNQQNAIEASIQFLDSLAADISDIDDSKTVTNLFSISNNTLVSASSLSNTQVIQVYFFQKINDENNKLPIYYKKPKQSPINFLVTASENSGAMVVEANYNHQIVSNNSSTYPIISAKQAYEALTSNQAYIANYEGTNNTIVIKDVSLGYFINDSDQDYLLPIVVFQGDDNFLAYVTAITPEWLSN